ncbi:MAG TPA: helix-turn-helix domain-containing protein [Solirubrobacteraceae bacterium]|nr:helix-turn-helix domain-containing protein [Solirubrobacteraceae bacterium]
MSTGTTPVAPAPPVAGAQGQAAEQAGAPARRLRADAARNRRALIEAAQRLFAGRGLSVTLDDIAAEAGVNVATAYRHFANKQQLATAFLEDKIAAAVAIAEGAAAAADPELGLREFFERTLELMAANRGLHEIIAPGHADPWLERLDELIAPPLERLIARAQRARVLRRGIEPGDLGVALQMLSSVTEIPTEDREATIGRYLALVLAGLRPDGRRLPGRAPSPSQARRGLTESERRRPRAAQRPR